MYIYITKLFLDCLQLYIFDTRKCIPLVQSFFNNLYYIVFSATGFVLSALSTTLCLEVVFSHKLNISLLHSIMIYTTTMCLDCLKIYIFNTRKSIPLLHSAMIYTCTTTLFLYCIIICIHHYIFNTKLYTKIIPFIGM